MISRIKADGSFVWQNYFYGNVYVIDCEATSDSGFVILSSFVGTISLGSHTITSSAINDHDLCLTKVDVNGNVQWMNIISSQGYDEGLDIAWAPSGIFVSGVCSNNLNVSGQSVTTSAIPHLYVAKLSQNGMLSGITFAAPNVVNNFSSTYFYSCKIAVDNQQDVILCINASDTYTLVGASITNQKLAHLFKLNNSLAHQWHGPASTVSVSSYYGAVNDLEVNSQHQIVLSLNQANGNFLHLYNSSGSQIATFNSTVVSVTQIPNYIKHMGGAALVDLDIDSCDNIYAVGFGYRHFPLTGYTTQSVVTCQFSPNLKLNWMERKEGGKSSGNSIVALGYNQCMISGDLKGMLVLQDTLGKYYSGYPGFIGTFTNAVSLSVSVAQNTVCFGQQATFKVNATAPVWWYTSSSSSVAIANDDSTMLVANPVGVITLYAEAQSCVSNSPRLPVSVTVMPVPQLTLNTGTICAGNIFTIIPAGAISYTFPASGNTIQPMTTSSYSVMGAGANGCVSTFYSTVNVLSAPKLNILGLNKVCSGQAFTLQCSGANSYTWGTGENTNEIVVSSNSNTTYTLSGTGANGCKGTFLFAVQVGECMGESPFAEIMMGNHEQVITYPNPARSELHISQALTNARLFDCTGKFVKLISGTCIDLTGLSPGIYFIEFSNAKNQKSPVKFVIEN